MFSASTINHIHQYEGGDREEIAPFLRQIIETGFLRFVEVDKEKFSVLIIPKFGTEVLEPRAWKGRWHVLGSYV